MNYDVLKANGLKFDTQNSNPSRYSRLPGVLRNGKKQYTGFRVTVSAQNPLGVVGGTEILAKLFAQTYADNLVAIADAMADMKGAPVTLIDGDGCEGVFAEARTRVDEQVLREKMWDCERRISGMCSPIKPDCPFYKMGKCNWR